MCKPAHYEAQAYDVLRISDFDYSVFPGEHWNKVGEVVDRRVGACYRAACKVSFQYCLICRNTETYPTEYEIQFDSGGDHCDQSRLD